LATGRQMADKYRVQKTYGLMCTTANAVHISLQGFRVTF
jgi:hypothetical protein